jgi:hypothetical protein
MQNRLQIVTSLAVAAVLAACSDVPMAEAPADQAARAFPAPQPGLAALYVYRDSGVLGAAQPFSASVGQRTLGQLAPATFFLVDLPPGQYDVRCTGQENSAAKLVDLAPGETRFVELSVRLSVGMPRCSLAEAPSEQGRAAVAAGHRAQDVR